MTHHPASHADLPSLLELAEMVATCIPFLPPAGQKNIGRVVEQLALLDSRMNGLDASKHRLAAALIFALEDPEATWDWIPAAKLALSGLPLPPPPKESE